MIICFRNDSLTQFQRSLHLVTQITLRMPQERQSHTVSEVPAPGHTDNTKDATKPPPSYDSLYGKVKEARKDSSGLLEFFKKVFTLILSTVGFTICVGLVLAIPISMVVIGAVYKDDCPIERYIPIYLIVAGCFGILKGLANLGQRYRNKEEEDGEEKNAKPNPPDMLLTLFLVAWFIAGNVWIYGVHKQWTADSTSPNYCHPTLYYFAFWITTTMYIIMAASCCCICCVGVVGAIVGSKLAK
ncbi:hypothetical protein ScPMuIL_010765 [Solemya velum]